jgi:BolA family transcriptional regulator, general stress-responsive regulator
MSAPGDGVGNTVGDAVGAAIEADLQARLQPQRLDLRNDSHLHAGHAGAREGSHFTVRVVAPCFQGLGRVARHRLVYDALGPLAPRGIHALAIEALAPGEV